MNIFKYFGEGYKIFKNPVFLQGKEKSIIEEQKTPSRTKIINFLLSSLDRETNYLEIGVRNPADNFNLIKANNKFSVDPGVEFEENPVDFPMTSDDFFARLEQKEITVPLPFDVIFIDGLHLAEQVDKDITNALRYIKDDGFIVLHDCNPPTAWHAREDYYYKHTPARKYWNGTTWKAFSKWRTDPSVFSCCVDTDWGVGIISKTHNIGKAIIQSNPFFEFEKFEKNRKSYLNLMPFETFEKIIQKALHQ